MKRINRILSWILIVVMLTGMLPVSAVSLIHARHTGSVTYVNPLYPDASAPEWPKAPGASVLTTEKSVSCSTIDDVAAVIRNAMENRLTTVQFSYTRCENDAAIESMFEESLDAAMEHTGVPTQGDYLRRQYGGCRAAWSYNQNSDGSVYNIRCTVTISYYTTAEQEAELTAAIDALFVGLDLSEMTDYEKVCGIYDYICDHVVYDYDNLNDDAHTLKYTAYAALINGTSVCQGYANLFYRLALELGVDTRIISGDAGGPHAWNIVELGDSYYYVDSTWDAGRSDYGYFLVGSDDFCRDHTPGEKYLVDSFLEQYPISKTGYVPTLEEPEDDVPEERGEIIASGECGGNVTWTLTEKGFLTIAGEGEIQWRGWDDYKDQVKVVVIENGVTNVCDDAFNSYTNLVSVALPESVTAIGSYAFAWCSAIVALNIPSRVTEIGEYAFEQCINWQGSVVVPYGVTKINKRTFDFCASLTDITLPRSITEIGEYAFCGCHSLTKLVIPEGVTEIDQMAFYSSQGLRSLVIPSSVTRIGKGAIGFTNIDTIYYTGTEEQWNRIVFRDTYDYSESIEVVFGWTGNSSAEYMISFDANGGSGVMETVIVGKRTMYLLPDCLLNPPAGKQFKAWNINGVELAAGDRISVSGNVIVTAVWENAAIVASGTCGKNLTWKLTENGVLTISGRGEMTESPDWLYSGYSGNILQVVIENGATSVGDGAFAGCSNLQRVVLPDSVISIGDNAFNGCTKLAKLTLPTSLIDIGSRAFYGCASLESMVIPDGVTSIGERAFYNCDGLQSVVLPDSVTGIGDYAFAWCGNLDSLHIPAGVTSIGQYVFRDCYELCEIAVDKNNSVYRVQDGMLFTGDMTQLFWCPNTESVRIIPDGVTKICDGAFGECADLQAIHIPASVKTIGEAILHDAVRKVYFSGTEEQWNAVEIGGANYYLQSYLIFMGSAAIGGTCGDSLTWKIAGNTLTISGMGNMYDFEQNGSPWQEFDCWITSVVIEDGVTSIGKFSLFDCQILERITIPASVTKIGYSYCPALTTVCYGGTKEQWKAIVENPLSNAEVVFAGSDKEPEKTNPFTDVPADAYYYDSVLWAYENGITKGTSDTTFGPTATCTRAQVVTFLWRAKGCPEPTSTVNPFTDVTEKDYFYKAVLWAVENGITNGMTATTFGSAATCTSGQVVTFLWRASGKPAATGESNLVESGYWYSEAVAWADSTGLLAGMGIVFAVDNQAPRADIVTYLYRDALKHES